MGSAGLKCGVVLLLLSLSACSQPAWRDLNQGRNTPELAPAVIHVALAELAAAKPKHRAKLTLGAGLPALPPWAGPLIGKPVYGVFPHRADCIGNVDAVRVRYLGAPSGAMVVGWAWDPRAKAPPPRVLLVDETFLIRGAGVSGAPRPGVPKVRPEVTSTAVGWEGYADRLVGPLDAWGVLADGHTICKLGHLEL